MSFYESEDERYPDDLDGLTETVTDYDINLDYSISATGISVNYEDEREDLRFVDVNISTEDPKYARAFDFLAEKLRNQENVTLAEWKYVLSRHDKLTGAITKITDDIAILADGSVTHNYDTRKDALHAYIGELVDQQNPQARAFARFAERLEANPSEEAKENVFNWFIGLTRQGERMSITNDGKLVAYKGVQLVDGVPHSIFQGPGIIEAPAQDTVFIEHASLPNRIGSTVSVQRSYVDPNPEHGCAQGLHAGTYAYARSWGNGNVLQVEIDPAHIVVIPDCSGFQKLRCHRYVVVGFVNDPITVGVVADHDFAWSPEDFEQWVDAGYRIHASKAYIARGIDLAEALEIEKEGGLTSAISEYTDANISELEALRFMRQGITVEEALEQLDGEWGYDEEEEGEVESTEPIELPGIAPVVQAQEVEQEAPVPAPVAKKKNKKNKRRKKNKR